MAMTFVVLRRRTAPLAAAAPRARCSAGARARRRGSASAFAACVRVRSGARLALEPLRVARLGSAAADAWATSCDLVHGWYPPETADDWDAVGLAAGDPGAEVRRILLAVDPALPVAREAADWDADLLLTHHPLFLRGRARRRRDRRRRAARWRPLIRRRLRPAHRPHQRRPRQRRASPTRWPGRSGCATSARRAAAAPPLDKLVVFVPPADAERVRAAHRRGRRRPDRRLRQLLLHAHRGGPVPARWRAPTPRSARSVDLEVVDEVRIEAVLPRSRARRPWCARCSPPTPTRRSPTTCIELADAGDGARPAPGRVGDVDETTLGAFADHGRRRAAADRARRAGRRRPRPRRTPGGRVRGSRRLPARPRRWRSGADVYVTSDLRHHVAAEFLEKGGPALLDVSHWAAEWTWLPELAARLARHWAIRWRSG